MRTRQVQGILLLLVIIVSAGIYNAATTKHFDPNLQEAQLTYETKKIQLKRENLRRYDTLRYYGMLGLLGAVNVSLLILAAGYARAKLKSSSVHTAHIGKHGSIPVHHKDLQGFYPIAVNLSLAEIESANSASHETAYQISRQMIEDITSYTRAIAGKRGLWPSNSGQSEIAPAALLPAQFITPTFAELLKNGVIAPGKPLVLGYTQGQPQYRAFKDLKSLAIAGWQGSGKTLSTAYIVASSVLAYGVQAYIVDPHKNHDEGLYALLRPLEKTGHVTVINPFDTPTLIHNLNQTLDRRLAGREPSAPDILLVIDELARLAKMDCFDLLIAFLERCTEETRKANMTFIGGSHKWTARHFKGRADIRGCMNSLLIHKTKPSQADLLLEDSRDKNLVKHLQRPGEAILVTDFDTPIVVSMPLCTRDDMTTVATMVTEAYTELNSGVLRLDRERNSQKQTDDMSAVTSKKPVIASPLPIPEAKRYPKDVIPFDLLRRKKQTVGFRPAFDPKTLTLETIQKQLQKRKQHDPDFTQAELAKQAGLSPGYLSKILRGQRPLSGKNKQRLGNVLFTPEKLENPGIRG
jgi:hypothetical protein